MDAARTMIKITPPHSTPSAVARKAATSPTGYGDVCSGIVELLNAARQAAARNINALMTASYWEIGRRIV
jgi:predicted nucleic acid-binding Zn ribbon protein